MIVSISDKPTVWQGTSGLMVSIPSPDDVVTFPFPGDAAFEQFMVDLAGAYEAAKARRQQEPTLPLEPSTQELLPLVRAAAHGECDDGAEEPSRLIVHCFIGGIGADWDLDAVEDTIANADEIRWIDDIFGHDLAVRLGDQWWRFDVKRPQVAA